MIDEQYPATTPARPALFEQIVVSSYSLMAGMPRKVALTACMRKLLTILNAMVKSGQP